MKFYLRINAGYFWWAYGVGKFDLDEKMFIIQTSDDS